MALYVVLLRGINVSGHNIIKMAELKQALSNLGLEGVYSYIQSGNLIFESDVSDVHQLKTMIEQKVKEDFELLVYCFVYSKKEFQDNFKNIGFTKDPEVNTKGLYFIHLENEPDLSLFSSIQENEKYPEKMELKGKMIYVNYINGVGRSKLTNKVFESKLKMKATARNFNTMKQLNQVLENW